MKYYSGEGSNLAAIARANAEDAYEKAAEFRDECEREKPMADQAEALCEEMILQTAFIDLAHSDEWRGLLITYMHQALELLENRILSEAKAYDKSPRDYMRGKS